MSLSRRTVVDGLLAGAVAWPLSELPSAIDARGAGAASTRTDRAAAALLAPRLVAPRRALALGAATRAAVSLNWGVVLSRWLDRRHPVLHGAGAGLAPWAFQYVLVGRRRPAVRALPALPQLADQVVFGTAAGAVLARRRR